MSLYRVLLSRRSTHYVEVEAESATLAGWHGERAARKGKAKVYEPTKDQLFMLDSAYEISRPRKRSVKVNFTRRKKR